MGCGHCLEDKLKPDEVLFFGVVHVVVRHNNKELGEKNT